MQSNNFQIVADIKLRHGVLFHWLKENQLSVAKLAKIAGISPAIVYACVNMKNVPRTSETKRKLEIATGIPFEEMFPYEYVQMLEKDWVKQRNFIATKEIPLAMLPGINFAQALPAPDKFITDQEQGAFLRKALATLNPREEEVLRLRFGVDQGTSYTLKEVGKRFELTVERMRQIEKRALEKLSDYFKKNGMDYENIGYD